MKKKKNTTKVRRELQKINAKAHAKLEQLYIERDRLKADKKEQKELEKFDAELNKEKKIFSNDSSLLDDFDAQLDSDNPSKELFTNKNVRFKTELSDEQRSAVSILYHFYRGLKDRGIEHNNLKYVLDEYIDFGVSLDRKSRTEYVESQKALNTQNQAQKSQNGVEAQVQQMKM